MDGDDTFSVTAYQTVTVNGSLILSAFDLVNGLLGSDTLDFSAFADALDLTLTDETTDGFGGNETSSGIAFSGIEILTGSANMDSIKGLDADGTWQMSGSAAGTYSIGAVSLAFSGFEILCGSAYQDILDYSLYTSGVTFSLSALDAYGSFSGSASGLSGFSGMDLLIGSAFADSLTGMDADATWSFTDTGDNYQIGANAITFQDIETLNGGIEIDTFKFSGSASFAGSLNGGTGADRLDYSAYTAGAIAIDLETFSATAIGGNFTGIEAFSGSVLEDTLSAGSGNDVIMVNAVDSGTINAIYSFVGIENVSGGAGDDQFVFGEDGKLSGTNGAVGGGGKDTLDYSGTSSARNIHLTGVDADGYAGYEQNKNQIFSGMDVLLATSGDSDRVYGIADGAATWTLDGADSTYQLDGAAQLLSFTGFELLYGSSADDTFIISGAETARIYAGAGHDDFVMLDGARWTAHWTAAAAAIPWITAITALP